METEAPRNEPLSGVPIMWRERGEHFEPAADGEPWLVDGIPPSHQRWGPFCCLTIFHRVDLSVLLRKRTPPSINSLFIYLLYGWPEILW